VNAADCETPAATGATPPSRWVSFTNLRGSPWARWSAWCAAILVLALAPWPGWGEAWADFYCELANATTSMAPTGDVRLLFRPGDDPSRGEERAPWRVYLYLQDTSSGAVQRIVENERLDYATLATFVALAGASSLSRRRTRWLWIAGLPATLAIVALEDADRILLALDGLHFIALGPALEVVLSAIYAFFNGMPVVPFALPVLLWWALGHADDRPALR
jgi:hypothetical protein